MKTHDERNTAVRPDATKRYGGGCDTTIHIANEATVNIYTCTPQGAPVPEPEPCPPPELPPTGACVPWALGHKPKQHLEARLRPLLENAQVPSVLPAAFFRMARRFLNGREPANRLETTAFDVFRRMTPEVQRVLACALNTFDTLAPEVRDRLFDADFARGEAPVEVEVLAERVAQELLQRTSIEVFGDGDCLGAERPGQVRVIDVGGEIGQVVAVTICRVNGLRTNDFSPRLNLGEYTPDELQHTCTLDTDSGTVQLNCEVQTEPCPGNDVDGTCLRVPEVRAGEAVILEGVNFFDVETRVRLEAEAPGTTVREVETHVCGDVDTPVTETVDGQSRTIADCRVRDVLTFRIPDDLPDGIYGLTVIVPNTVGLPGFGDEFTSNRTQFIRVVPSETATFQITAETLDCILETAAPVFRNAGSDEVAISALAIPIGLDLTPGEVITQRFRFGDVDTGETRQMNRVLFRESGIGGVALSITGFEVDSEDAFEQQIRDFEDAYIEILASGWSLIAGSLGTIGGAIAAALGVANAWVTVIAAAVTFAVQAVVAIWAPADLIIEDAAGFTVLGLGALTSPNLPPPGEVSFTSAGDIDVRIVPVRKGVEYVERREYRSDNEDSEYHITLRYNRQ